MTSYRRLCREVLCYTLLLSSITLVSMSSSCAHQPQRGVWDAIIACDALSDEHENKQFQIPRAEGHPKAECWVITRFVVPAGVGAEATGLPTDAGLLIPVADERAVGSDYMFSQAIFFPDTHSLRIALRDFVRDSPTVIVGGRSRLPEHLSYLIDYGDRLPPPAVPSMKARELRPGFASGGIYIMKLSGQVNTSASLVISVDDWHRPESEMLERSYFMRTEADLRRFLRTVCEDEVMLIGTWDVAPSEPVLGRIVVPCFHPQDDMIVWIRDKRGFPDRSDHR